jgi:hypothetical protein
MMGGVCKETGALPQCQSTTLTKPVVYLRTFYEMTYRQRTIAIMYPIYILISVSRDELANTTFNHTSFADTCSSPDAPADELGIRRS